MSVKLVNMINLEGEAHAGTEVLILGMSDPQLPGKSEGAADTPESRISESLQHIGHPKTPNKMPHPRHPAGPNMPAIHRAPAP